MATLCGGGGSARRMTDGRHRRRRRRWVTAAAFKLAQSSALAPGKRTSNHSRALGWFLFSSYLHIR